MSFILNVLVVWVCALLQSDVRRVDYEALDIVGLLVLTLVPWSLVEYEAAEHQYGARGDMNLVAFS